MDNLPHDFSCHDWFVSWFDTPYYHILYKNRNFEEAEEFIQNIIQYLKFSPNASLLDNACGKGRHAIYLSKLGFNVTGLDLSTHSIEYAQQFANPKLHFEVHDMRELYTRKKFDGIFNLFTSFGYFEDRSDDIKVLKSIRSELNEGGVFVLDFFNTAPIIEMYQNEFVYLDSKSIENIQFDIRKEMHGNKILKQIEVVDQGRKLSFSEQVSLYTLEDFEKLFSEANFSVQQVFGSYKLDIYNPDTSDRMIFIVRGI